MKYVFVLDESKCVACGACAIACMDQNDIDVAAGDTPFRTTFVIDENGIIEQVFLPKQTKTSTHAEQLLG